MVRRNTARRISAALFVAYITYLTVDTTYFFSLLDNDSEEDQYRNLIVNIAEECNIEVPTHPSQPIIPVYASSYPGSGELLTHHLYEALTGIRSGNVWVHRGDDGSYVTLKTHYPTQDRRGEGIRHMHRAILLLRHPLYAFPSHASKRYEKENNLERDHTGQNYIAPVEYWVKWRDENFVDEMRAWVKHLNYWMSGFDNTKRIVISYDSLIDGGAGPHEAVRIARFLGEEEGVTTVPEEHIPCVWEKVVNTYTYHDGDRRKLALSLGDDNNGSGYSSQKKRNRVKQNENLSKNINLPLDDNGNEKNEKSTGSIDLLSPKKKSTGSINLSKDVLPGSSSLNPSMDDLTFTKAQLQTIYALINLVKEKYQSRGNEHRIEIILDDYLKEVKVKLMELIDASD